jgi:hypothetical protein
MNRSSFGVDMESPDSPLMYEQTVQPPRKSRFGCFMWGCLSALIAGVLLCGVVGGGGYWWIRTQVQKYTVVEGLDLPVIQIDEESLLALDERMEQFQQALEQESAEGLELVLTADELNALIQKNEQLRGRVFVQIADGKISGQISIPTDGLPGGRGRFLNASATAEASLRDGKLDVRLIDAEVRGEKVPEVVMQALAKENIAEEFTKDPDAAKFLSGIESMEIIEDRVILRTRPVSSTEE